ncbi:Retrovirus-related Pol polyprotein, partial [Mucuna pruriens]
MVQVNEGQEMIIQSQTAYCQCLTRGTAKPNTEQWYFNIKRYLEKGEYPDEASEGSKRTLRRLASGFLLSGTILYKRNTDMTLLRCVDSQEAEQIMEEVHEGIFGTHVNGHALARKILRAGYYWTQMEADCYQHVRKCAKCQIHANRLNAAPSTLHNLTAPWPFSMWGIDVIGPIEPKASNGHRFILVAIDYFTKWVETTSYSSVTRSTVVRFIKKDIICRYGLPPHIITDNGTNLNNKMMTELCEQFRIFHHNSTPYRPKMNGTVEAANKNLKKIIQKMVVTYKDWHEMLPYALHGYRTSVRTSTGATPYSLVYGTEAVLPIEVEIPSLRVLDEAKLDEAEWIQQRLDQLNLIEEKRLTALCHGQLYQRRVKKAFDKKVKPRVFQKGDMVLKRVLPNIKDQRGKWAPNYEGPYVVKQAFSGGALILTNAEGQDLAYPVNADAVRMFYP